MLSIRLEFSIIILVGIALLINRYDIDENTTNKSIKNFIRSISVIRNSTIIGLIASDRSPMKNQDE